MTNKEKLWRKIVRMYKAEAKRRYRIGDRIATPYNSGNGYRIHKGSVYRVLFEEGRDYDISWLSVTVSDSKTGVVAEVYDGSCVSVRMKYYGKWDIPFSQEANITLKDRGWDMPLEIFDEYQKFLALGEEGFKPTRKHY